MWTLLLDILLVLAVAFLLGAIAQRLKQSAIIGYLLTGALVGSIMFNSQVVIQVAEIGVALLLFSIGLEFSFQHLKRFGAIAFGGGSLQVAITLGVTATLLSLRFPPATAVTLGAMAALSSTAVVLRILVDRAEIDSVPGRSAVGILLLQDMAVVPLVLLVSVLGDGDGHASVLTQTAKALAGAGLLVGVFYLLFYHLIPRLLFSKGMFANRDLSILITIVAALGSIQGAHYLGLSPALGAFLAGMLLAESPFATQIRSDIAPLRTLFVTLFFTSIGMLVDPVWLFGHLPSVLAATATVFIVKALIVYGICRVLRIDPPYALATGIILGQVGEFSFVLATAAQTGGLIDADTFAWAVSVTILSLFLSPYMVAYAQPLAAKVLARVFPRYRGAEPAAQTTPEGGCNIFIIGFGPAGQEIADALIKRRLPPIVVELNPQTARLASSRGLVVHIGDSTSADLLEHAGVKAAGIVVVSVPDPRTSAVIIKTLRLLAPRALLIVRCRYHMTRADLEKSGADLIVDEEFLVGRSMAQEVIKRLQQDQLPAMACVLGGQEIPLQMPANGNNGR